MKNFFHLIQWIRLHSALKGKKKSQIDSELADKTHFQEVVELKYDESKEHIKLLVYAHGLAIRRLKG